MFWNLIVLGPSTAATSTERIPTPSLAIPVNANESEDDLDNSEDENYEVEIESETEAEPRTKQTRPSAKGKIGKSNVIQQEEELPVPSQKCKKGEKPSKNDNFSWSNMVRWDPPRSSCIQEKNSGFEQLRTLDSPIRFVDLFLTDDIIEHITFQTNLYSTQ